MSYNIVDDVRKQLGFDDLEESELYEGIKLPVTYVDYFGEGGQVSVFTAAKNACGEIVEINDEFIVIENDKKQYVFAIEHITCICVSIEGECIDE